MGFNDINDIRNGLLLCKPLEWAFDNSKLSIVPDTSFDPISFQVWVEGVCGCLARGLVVRFKLPSCCDGYDILALIFFCA